MLLCLRNRVSGSSGVDIVARWCAIGLLILNLVACAGSLTDSDYETNSSGIPKAITASGFDKSFLANGTPEYQATEKRTSEIIRGQSKLGGGSSEPVIYASDERVNLNLQRASIDAAAQAIIQDILGLTYIIDPDVSGTITLRTANSIKLSALLDAFNTVLAFNGAGLVKRDDVVYISPLSKMGALPPKVQRKWRKNPAEIGHSIRIVPLDFVAAKEIANLLKPLIGEEKIIHVDQRQNIIFIAGNPREIDVALDAIRLFDVDVMEGKSFALIPVKNTDAEVIAKELDTVFSTQEGGALAGLVKFVPNNRLASILAISSRPHYLEKARSWVTRLDHAAAGTKQSLFIYSVQNREANELAVLLEGILGRSSTDPENGATSANANLNQASGDATSINATNVAVSSTANSTIGQGQFRIVADTANNAVLVYATQAEYDSILPMIRRLDSLPNQVLLEATIAEITLTDELKFGLRWYLESGNFAVSFSDASNGATGRASPGFSLVFSAGQSQIALNALSSITDVNIISSPNLMVLDNRKAILQIGDQVPIATESAVDAADQTVVNSIELKDTGIILTVTPRVNDSGRVILDISQEVSDVVQTTTSGIDSPTIRQRKVTTTVVVNDGDSLALGGLIQQRKDVTKSQVPVLGDVPVLGTLFRHKQDTDRRTELLILITPHVIRDLLEANSVTEEFRKQLGGLRVLGDKPKGGLKHQVDRILK